MAKPSSLKTFLKNFQKSVDKLPEICYNKTVERDKSPKGKEVRNMWYVACGCDVYKVTENGNCYTLYKRFKTERGAKNWVARH